MPIETIVFRLPKDMAIRGEELAKKMGVSIHGLAKQLLMDCLERETVEKGIQELVLELQERIVKLEKDVEELKDKK